MKNRPNLDKDQSTIREHIKKGLNPRITLEYRMWARMNKTEAENYINQLRELKRKGETL